MDNSFFLTFSMTKMNAQQNLNDKEQSLVKISSLTAIGNFENGKSSSILMSFCIDMLL